MSEFEKKGIEKFFRSRLRNINSEPGDWSTPPDFVFTNAIDSIQQTTQSKRKRLFLAFLFFTIIGLLSLIIITQNRQINDVQESLKQIEDKLIANQTDKPNSNQQASLPSVGQNHSTAIESSTASASEDQTRVKQSSISRAQTVKENSASNNAKPNPLVRSENQNIVNVFTKNYNQTHQSSAPPNPLDSSRSAANSSDFTSRHAGTNNTTENQQKSIHLLSNSPLFDGVDETEDLLLTFPSLNRLVASGLIIPQELLSKYPTVASFDRQNSINKGFYFVASSGINLSSFYMNNIIDQTNQNLVNYDKSCSGHYFESGLHYQLNSKWSGGLTFHYNKINNNSQYNESSPVDQSNMSIVNNQMEYDMPMKIITPLGSHIMNSKVLFNENEVVANVISTSSDITQHLIAYGIGISARYSAFRSSKLHTYFGLNLSRHFLNQVNSDFQTKIMMDGEIKKEFNMNSVSINKAYQDYTSLSAQLGLEYALSQRFHITFNSSLGRSLNSLAITETDTDPKTYLRNINAGLGVKYNLTSKN